MTNVLNLTDAGFDREVEQSDIPVLVDYWASWCGPSRSLGPIVEEIAAERAGTLKVAKVNVDDDPRLAERAGVQGIPLVVLYRGGKPVARAIGPLPKVYPESALGLDAQVASAA